MLEQPSLEPVQATEFSDKLVFWLNGEKVTIDRPEPDALLSTYLHEIGLTGTKVGCGQGGCGACTVLISDSDPQTGKQLHSGINACLRPLCALDGATVTTTEGLGTVRTGLDPAQFAIAKCNGTQCGFCTPGFVMNAHAVLRNHPQATEQHIEDNFGGNICRCTGYRPILHAVRTLASDYNASQDCTMKCQVDPSYSVAPLAESLPITTEAGPKRALHFRGAAGQWVRPLTLGQVRAWKARLEGQLGQANVQLVVGNTSMGIYPDEKPRAWIDVAWIPELLEKTETEAGLRIGGSVRIQELIDLADEIIARRPAYQTAGLRELSRHGKLIAGRQVRSAGSIVGNIVITRRHAEAGEPFPSDLFTLLATLGTRVTLVGQGTRTMPLTDLPAIESLAADELIVCFDIPFTHAREYVQTHRVARRPQNSHALVAAGFRARLNDDGKIEPGNFSAVFAGISRMVVRFPQLEDYMTNKPWNQETLTGALAVLHQEILPIVIHTEHEGTGTEYRIRLAEHYFYKFFLSMAMVVNPDLVDPANHSAAHTYVRPLSHGRQETHEHPELFPMSLPIIKRAAFVQSSGETRYTQDLPLPTGGLHGAIVKSTRAHAKFTFSPGLEQLDTILRGMFSDFRGIVTVDDVPGESEIGLGEDDPVFSRGLVTSVGARIALCVAQTEATARKAALYVQQNGVAYEDLPAVLTLDEAIEQNTALPMKRKSKDPDEDIQQRLLHVVRPGSQQEWLANPVVPLPGTQVVSGSQTTGAQAHFYLETNVAIAIPGEYQHMTVYTSTQNPNGDQRNLARVLDTKVANVSVVLNQIGGGFGGKQHQAANVSCAAAVAARKYNKAVRLCYDRATDMECVGKRHPYLGHYHMAYTPEGVLRGMALDLHSDAGDTYDCSFAVMDLSLLMSDGTYNVDTFEARGTIYKTNKTSNTAFRTFGTVQPYLVFEDAIEQIAWKLSAETGKRVLPEEIRRKNLYTAKDRAPYGQSLAFTTLPEVWEELWKTSEFESREQQVQEFNKTNRWRKRGISMHAIKYGIGFTEPRGSLNSSTALVNVNLSDGSVVITHGGVEMGQGLHTKIAQVAANTLGIGLENIRITGNNSDTIVNAPATAASTGYDLNAGAVEKACGVLRKRLERFCEDLEQYTPHTCIEDWRMNWSEMWPEIVAKAWLNRINLSSAELYKSPHYEGPSETHPQGHPFLYYVYAAATTEVEMDVLTGETVVLRSDVLYDVGKSPNPAVDIGQIEGGFVQGLGMMMTEEILFDEKGKLITDNTWSYKPPCTKSIPVDLRVSLMTPDERMDAVVSRAEYGAVKNSRTSGEPCLVLAVSAYLAIKRAVLAAREGRVATPTWPRIDVPATVERVQTHCEVTPAHLTL